VLIHGEADVDIPIINSETLAGVIPYAQLLRVPGAGHVKAYAVDSRRYLETVNNFLKEV